MRQMLKELFFDAEDFLEEGETELAIKTYQTALKNAKKDDEEEFLAITYLAMAFDDADNQKKSHQFFKKSQQLALKIFGKESLEFAVALSNQGMTYANRNHLKRAEPLLEQATAILQSLDETSLAREREHHPPGRDIELYANAADCKARLGKMHEAVALFTLAHKTAKAALPDNHPTVTDSALDLATALDAAGQKAQAKKLREEAFIDEDPDSVLGLSLFVDAFTNACKIAEQTKPSIASRNKQSSASHKLASNVVPLHSKRATATNETALDNSCAAYQFKVTLKGVRPPIWRRIVVLSSLSLAELHYLIQKGMGWENCHLHEFQIGTARFGDRKQVNDVKDEGALDLADFKFEVGSKFTYLYDFGDGWHHTIEVEKILTEEEFEASDVFVTGKGACPPEDCGGPYGFMNLLQALKDPSARHKLPEWLDEYDPKQLPDCF